MKKKYIIPEMIFFEEHIDVLADSYGYGYELGKDGQYIEDFFE